RPAGDGAVLGGEEEAAGCRKPVLRDDKPRPTVEDHAGGGAVRDRRAQRHGLAAPVQDIRDAGAVVSEPEGTRGAERDAPGIDQVRVCDTGQARHVRSQVDLGIAPREKTPLFQALQNRPIRALPSAGSVAPREKSPTARPGTHESTLKNDLLPPAADQRDRTHTSCNRLNRASLR